MNVTQSGLLILLKSAVTGEKLALPEGFSLEDADKIIRSQSLLPLAYQGAYNCGIPADTEWMQKCQKQYFKILMHSQKQMRAAQQLYRAFEENGIDYMPLKGCNLKGLYPQPEMRMMGDADILIRMEQYPQIKAIVEAQGYAEGKVTQHELHWEKQELYLELHKCLFSEEERDLYPYYGDGWQRAVCESGNRYVLQPEDEYIYLFTHMTKHYRSGGIGCRQLLDLFVYRNAHPKMDEAYIEKAAEEIHLLVFYRNIRDLLAVWFAQQQPDEITELMTQFVFSGGNWGSEESVALSNQVKRNAAAGHSGHSKWQTLWKLIFPDIKFLQHEYPELEKHHWLYPVCWLKRAVKILFFQTERIGRKVKVLEFIDDEKVSARKKQLQYVGLDFHEDSEHGE